MSQVYRKLRIQTVFNSCRSLVREGHDFSRGVKKFVETGFSR
jgi:hypothetical protein